MTCAANCGPLSEMMASGNPVRFHTLSSSSWLVCSAVIVLLQEDKIIALCNTAAGVFLNSTKSRVT